MKHHFALTTIAAFALATFPCLAAIAQSYSVQDLGTLGGSYIYATALNEFGDVVGTSATTGNAGYHAFRWQPGRFQPLSGTGIQVYIPPVLSDLTPGYAANSNATGINNAGMVLVNIFDSSGESPYIWTEGSGPGYVPIYIDGQGSVNCSGQSINDSGDIVGSALDPFGNTDAYVWADSVTSVLAVHGGANSINADSHEVGDYYEFGHDQAFLSDSALMQTLNTPTGTDTIAVALNDSDLVLGNWYVGNDTYAVIWNDTVMTSLGTLGGNASYAAGINNQGQVVGMSTTRNNSMDAFLYTNGAMRDINSLIAAGTGWTLVSAMAINDMEQIAGWGVHNGATRAFLLTPRYAINATSRVSIARGVLTGHGFGHPYSQTVTITNTSTRPIVGTVSLVLDSLVGAALDNATGTTASVAPLGSPYININIGAENTLGPGAQASVTLQLGHSFFSPPISYTPRLLIGSGSR